MKAYNLSNRKTAKAFVKQEMKDIDLRARKETAVQLMATVLYAFDKTYGWKKKRLTRAFKVVNDMFKIMDAGCFGKKFNAEDNVKYIKETYGIDLEKEIKIEVEEK